jgi:ABC-type nitrate/sulfonate/bicarbonate transport system permease component
MTAILARSLRQHRNLPLTCAAALAVLAVLAAWQVLSALAGSILFPSATDTFLAFLGLAASGTLLEHIAHTMRRVLVGFVIGGLLGAALGLIMGSVSLVRTLFEPYVNFFRFVTPIVWIGPAIIWFGVGDRPTEFLIAYASIFVVLINTMAGVGHLHRDRVRMAHAFGADAWQILALVIIPSAMPFVLTGLRIAMGNCVMTAVTAEIVAGNNGIGYLIYSSRVYFEFDIMFASIATLGVIGLLADRLFVIAERTLFWRYRRTGH